MDQRRSYIVLSSADINAKKKLVVHPTVRPPIVPLQVKDEPIQRNDVFLTAFHDYASSDHDNQSEDDNKPPRKKACLAQLSEDEKNLCRKMKNRESAQTSRDRKKCYLESLEKRVNELEQEKLTLHQAKQFVDEKCSNLEDENRKLRQQLLQGDVGNSGFVKKDPKADVSHWESVCRQLMAEKEELKIKVQELEEKLNGSAVAELASCSNDQLEHFYPIESEVEVKTCEESSESAALEVSPQQSHFLRVSMKLNIKIN